MSEDFPASTDSEHLPMRQRLAWMAGIWLASVGVMVAVSLVIRAWIVT